MKKDISANFDQKCLILCSKILLNVLQKTSLKVSLPWQHNGLQKGFPGQLWNSILMFANDSPYVWSSKHINWFPQVGGLIQQFSSWKSLTSWNQLSGDWKRMSCHGSRIFSVTIGVFPVELLAYQVSMVCAANWPRKLYLYTWYNIELSVSLICIFYRNFHIQILLIQILKNGRQCFYSFKEFYVIHLKSQEVKFWS